MFVLVIFLFMLTKPFVTGQDETDDERQNPDGSVSFVYFTVEGKATAGQLLKFLTQSDDTLAEYTEELKTSNNASLALTKCIDALNSAKETNCSSNYDPNFEQRQEDIETTVRNCAAFIPQDNREALKDVITAALVKIQEADNNIQELVILCSSPNFLSCQNKTTKAVKEIESILSNTGKERFLSYSTNFYVKAVEHINSCVEYNTKELVDELVASTQLIGDCMDGNTNNNL